MGSSNAADDRSTRARIRAACDEHVTAVIAEQKQKAIAEGPGLGVLGAIRDTDIGPLAAYLARVLAEDSPAVNDLIDGLIADAEVHLAQGVDTGMVRPTDDQRGRAIVLTTWSLGALVLHRHIEQRGPVHRRLRRHHTRGTPLTTRGPTVTSPAIQTTRLTKHYGEFRALVDLDLEVQPGEVFGFLGPNGAGKTTMIRTLLDEIRPTSGTATIHGLDTHAKSVEIRRHLGYLPGDIAMYPKLTGRETLTYFDRRDLRRH